MIRCATTAMETWEEEDHINSRKGKLKEGDQRYCKHSEKVGNGAEEWKEGRGWRNGQQGQHQFRGGMDQDEANRNQWRESRTNNSESETTIVNSERKAWRRGDGKEMIHAHQCGKGNEEDNLDFSLEDWLGISGSDEGLFDPLHGNKDPRDGYCSPPLRCLRGHQQHGKKIILTYFPTNQMDVGPSL